MLLSGTRLRDLDPGMSLQELHVDFDCTYLCTKRGIEETQLKIFPASITFHLHSG